MVLNIRGCVSLCLSADTLKAVGHLIIIIIIYTTYIAPYIWPVWPFIGAEEGPSKY